MGHPLSERTKIPHRNSNPLASKLVGEIGNFALCKIDLQIAMLRWKILIGYAIISITNENDVLEHTKTYFRN